MKKFKILSLLLPFLAGSLFASNTRDTSPELEKFINTYSVPKDIEKLIPKNTDQAKVMCFQTQSPWLYFSGQDAIYCSKSDEIDRITNAERMRNCIEENNLSDTLSVPKKYVRSNGKSLQVITEGIEFEKITQLTSKEVTALMKLQEDICYTDFHPDNLVRNTKTRKITLIDTENRSYSGGGLAPSLYKDQCASVLYQFMAANNLLNDEIKTRLTQQHEREERRCLNTMNCYRHGTIVECKYKNPFLKNPDLDKIKSCEDFFTQKNFLQETKRFDRDGIDHAQAQKEFDELKKRRWNGIR